MRKPHLLLLVALLLPPAALCGPNCTNNIEPGDEPYCRLHSGPLPYVNCSCYSAALEKNVSSIYISPDKSGPCFVAWTLTVSAALKVDYVFSTLDQSAKWTNVSARNVTDTTKTSGIVASLDNPVLMWYEAQATPTATEEQDPALTFSLQTLWMPCNDDAAPTVDIPASLDPGVNFLEAHWAAPLEDAPASATAFLNFEFLLDADSSGTFVVVGTAPGSQTSARIPVQRGCQQQTLRIRSFGVDASGKRGPDCPAPYKDAVFYARVPPANPGEPKIDDKTLRSTYVSASWPGSADNGSCPFYYVVVLADAEDGQHNLTVVETNTTSVALNLTGNPMQLKHTYSLTVSAVSEAGRTSHSTSFTLHDSVEDQQTFIIEVSAITIGGICILGYIGYMIIRWFHRRAARTNGYTALN